MSVHVIHMYIHNEVLKYCTVKTLAEKSLVKRLLQRIGKKTLAYVDLHHQSPTID